jgi:hypothetical protein
VNVKNAKAFFELKPNELSCLPNWPTVNPHNPHTPGFAPSRNYSRAACGELTFRKEAILAGIDEEDEDFIDKGKKLFDDKYAEGYVSVPSLSAVEY